MMLMEGSLLGFTMEIKKFFYCTSLLNDLAGLICALSNLVIFIERILEFSEVYLI
jgi:hypothetical protein